MWTLSVTTPSPPALTGTSVSQGGLMTAVLSTCPGAGIAEINSKHNRLSGSQLPQVNFPHTVQGKKRPKPPAQDKKLSFPNYCGNASLSETRNQVAPEHPQEATNTGGSRAWEGKAPAQQVGGHTDSAQHSGQSERLKIHRQERLCPGPDIPRSREVHHSKRHMHPN